MTGLDSTIEMSSGNGAGRCSLCYLSSLAVDMMDSISVTVKSGSCRLPFTCGQLDDSEYI